MKQFQSPYLVTEHSSDDIWVAMQKDIAIQPLPGEVPEMSTGFWDAMVSLVLIELAIAGGWWCWRLFW